MLAPRPTGPGAASQKYDLLTALGAHGCAAPGHDRVISLRLMTLVTARYNWARDELSAGRAEIARLWAVNERTVKRDLARLKTRGWLFVRRPSARGRVTIYGIDWQAILLETRPVWSAIGPDFEERLAAQGGAGTAAGNTAPATTVVPFPPAPARREPARETSGDTRSAWDRALALMALHDPAFCRNWLTAVRPMGVRDGILTLAAPTPFHAQYLATHGEARMLSALTRVAPGITRLVVTSR